MSGTDLLAIFCFLLTGGGLAYLVRSSRKAKAALAEPVVETGSRNAQTIPPKLLRSQTSEAPPPSTHREPPSAPSPKAEPERKTPGSASPIKATLVSSGSDDVAKAGTPATPKSDPAPKVDKKADAKVESKPEPKPEPKKADDKKVEAKPAAVEAKKVEPKPEPKKADDRKVEAKPAAAGAKKADEKKAEPKPAVEAKKADAPSKDVKAPPSSQKLPAAKKADPAKRPAVTPKTTIVAGSNAPPPEAAKKKADAFAEIPKLQVEDDDDVEPTKVGKIVRREIQPPVEKHIVDEGADKDPPPVAKAPFVVYAVARTDPGRRRKQNEDAYLLLDEQGVFVVADGMGGHRGGQIASNLAVKTIGDAFEKKKFEAAAHLELPPAASELARAMQMANAAIMEEATATPDLKGMGTTLVAARFTADRQRLYIGHVGDSRCYRIRDGVMKQITTDHTMADYGVSGPEGAHLSRAVGVWPTVPIDIIMASPQLGDTYLICSDGLTKMLTNETIATQLVHEDDAKAAVSRLVMFANAHGGKDNITVVLLRIVSHDWKPPA